MPAEILIVDDRPANLLALEALLAPLGRRVIRAESGEAALRVLLSTQVAVILLDVQMQGLDGFQTAALIRGNRRTRETPIIFVTAYDLEFKQARRAYDLGAFDYITKPFDNEILCHKVRAFIRYFEQGEQLRKAEEEAHLRDVFVGVLGHDLRNPLSTIQAGTALLHESNDVPARHQKTIERVQHPLREWGD